MALLYGPHVFLDVLSVMSCSTMIIPLLDITLNIWYMIWSMYICWLSDTKSCHCENSFIYVFKKKKKGRHISDTLRLHWEVVVIFYEPFICISCLIVDSNAYTLLSSYYPRGTYKKKKKITTHKVYWLRNSKYRLLPMNCDGGLWMAIAIGLYFNEDGGLEAC
jgi:hypothetical protein